MDEGIADGGEKHFVNVQREGGYAKVGGEWFRDPCEQRRWREWKRVEHFGRRGKMRKRKRLERKLFYCHDEGMAAGV